MLSKLSARERLFVLYGSFLVLFLFIAVGLKKIINLKTQYSSLLSLNQESLREIDDLIDSYRVYKNSDGIGKTDVSQIYARLDELFVKYELKSNVSNLKDTTTTSFKIYDKFAVSVDLKSVYLDDVFKLIYDIEKNKYIQGKVEYLSFQKPFASRDVYDIRLTLAVYSKKD